MIISYKHTNSHRERHNDGGKYLNNARRFNPIFKNNNNKPPILRTSLIFYFL